MSGFDIYDFYDKLYPWLPAGAKLLKACQQDEFWTAPNGQALLVEDIDDDHAKRLIVWLERRANILHRTAVICAEIALAATQGIDEDIARELDELDATNPVDYVRSLVFHKKLSERFAPSGKMEDSDAE